MEDYSPEKTIKVNGASAGKTVESDIKNTSVSNILDIDNAD